MLNFFSLPYYEIKPLHIFTSQGSDNAKLGLPDYKAGYWIGSNTIFTAPENGMIITDIWGGNEVSIDQMHIGIGDRGTTYIVKKGQKGFFHFGSYFIPFH